MKEKECKCDLLYEALLGNLKLHKEIHGLHKQVMLAEGWVNLGGVDIAPIRLAEYINKYHIKHFKKWANRKVKKNLESLGKKQQEE